MPRPEILLFEFNEDNLANALSSIILNPTEVKNKKHFIYLLDYLGSTHDGLGCKTIVVENEYISKSYLRDYSDYYSTCFSDYKRKTKRVHFFTKAFTEENFLNELLRENNSNQEMWDSYLGFVVIKPLPEAIIGPTLLKTFLSTVDLHRKYPAVVNCTVHLFGKQLSLDSLMYQEQDTILSACATTALWSAFHKTSDLFDTAHPSPSEITQSAGNLFFISGRTFPSHGLDFYQICKSIENIGLVSELRNKDELIKNIRLTKAFIYSYLKMGLPVLLGIDLDGVGRHLVTLVGYREQIQVKRLSQDLSLVGEQIERFYAHDDQIGPFSRIGFENDKVITSWWDQDISDKIKATISAIIIPINAKIRITFEDIYKIVNIIDKIIYLSKISSIEIIWDVFLDFSNNYKEEMRKHPGIADLQKYDIILKSMPRFIWRAKALIDNDTELMEIVFDATDINRGCYCFSISFYDENFKVALIELFSLKEVQDIVRENIGFNYLGFFSNTLSFPIL